MAKNKGLIFYKRKKKINSAFIREIFTWIFGIFTAVFIAVVMNLFLGMSTRVVGTSMGLPGIWVLAAVTVGGSLLGLAGMVVSVPIAAVAYTLLKNDLRARLSAQGTPPAPEEPGPEA